MKKPRTLQYQPLYIFCASNDADQRTEITQSIDQLNLRMTELSPGKSFTDEYIGLLGNAQTASDAGNWGDAHKLIWNATFLINRAIETINKRFTRMWLAVTPLFTFALLIFCNWLLDSLNPDAPFSKLKDYFPFLWAGAFGGTTIVYWGIVKHTIQLDFDDQYVIWYYFKPLLGAIFGFISVLIVKAGFISMQGQAIVTNQLPLYFIAFIAGFSERFFMQLIDRVTTALFGGSASTVSPNSSTPSQVIQKTRVGETSLGSISENTGNEPEHPGLP